MPPIAAEAVTSSSHHLNVLLLLGVAVFGGTVGARIFRRLHIPQIIGSILIGLLIGQSGLHLVSEDIVGQVEPLNYFALGIIGFLIGGELKLDILRKYGKQFTAILLAEGVAAFLLVAGATILLTYAFTQDLKMSVALGVVLGAISSATDPASTIQVLWEYKTRGTLTTAVIAIVALDDALALTLYAVGTSVAGILTGNVGGGIVSGLATTAYELAVAMVVGCVGGLALRAILIRIQDEDAELTFAVGAVLLAIGLSIAMELDVILSSMALGLTLANSAPYRSPKTFEIVKRFAPPIYVLFFVLVGARLKVESMSSLALLLVVAYVLGRSFGKIGGAHLGARWSAAPDVVRKYLGLCLFAQGGVAIGLSILASHRFTPEISSVVILVVATTTFIVQLLGPLFVKLGVQRAGEIGLNVREQDLIEAHRVVDVMDKTPPIIPAGTLLKEVIRIVSETESSYYPVVDRENRLSGAITLHGIRNTFATQELNDWLVALDIQEPVVARIRPDMPLSEAFHLARRYNLDCLPVVVSDQSDTLAGVLDCPAVRRSLAAEVLSRQQKADTMHGAQCSAES
ncbi:MAG: cation:proton antiporter [Phycisphaerae bacterium]|nr:cation:proton antiporter [Phycisphaerae bacterium]